MPRHAIDKLLLGQPELRSRFMQMAADPVVSGDQLMTALNAAGIPAKRSATYSWQKKWRSNERHRPGSVLAKVIAAVHKLGRGRLLELAKQLGVGTRDE